MQGYWLRLICCINCRVIRHYANVCKRGPSPMKGKWPHTTSGYEAPSETVDVVEKQHPNYAGTPANSPDTYVAAATVSNLKAHSPDCKISKVSTAGAKQSTTLHLIRTAEDGATLAEMNTKRQYLTRSRAAATSLAKQKLKGPTISLSSSDTTPPSFVFSCLFCGSN